METNKDIGNGIKNRLQDYSKSPDALVWKKIEADLKKKKKRRFFIIFFSAIGLSLLTLLIYKSNTLKFTQKNLEPTTQSQSKKSNSEQKDKLIFNKTLNDSLSLTKETTNTIVDSLKKENNLKTNNSYSLNVSDSKSKSLIKNNQASSVTFSSNTSSLKNNLVVQTNNNQQVDDFKNKSKDYKKLIDTTESSQTSSFKISEKNIDFIPSKLISENKRDTTSKLDSIKPTKTKRWSIFPHSSLDYFGSFNHSSTNNTSVNFGVKVSYHATEDLSLRLGANRLNLNFSSNEASNNFTQKINYLELPLEIKQKLIKGKINTSVIAGVSYLLLDYAELTTNNISNTLQIDTIEDSNMSINLGLGFDTVLYKKLHFNIEPMFKYQLKPLENRLKSQTFTLSIIGGLEYRF